MARLPELQEKTLVCWCKPNPCHGDVLIELLKEQDKHGEGASDPNPTDEKKKSSNSYNAFEVEKPFDQLPDVDSRLRRLVSENEEVRDLFDKFNAFDAGEDNWGQNEYAKLIYALSLEFDYDESISLISSHANGVQWDRILKKGTLIHDVEKLDTVFDVDRLNKQLSILEMDHDPIKRIGQLNEFVRNHVLIKDGTSTELKTYIKTNVCTKFGFLNKEEQRDILREFTVELKAIEKKQKSDTEKRIKENQPTDEEYKIDAEFKGLYTPVYDQETNKLKQILVHEDQVAGFVAGRTRLLTYKDSFYIFNENMGYYKEDKHAVEAEATRVLNGIFHGTRSPGVIEHKAGVMNFVTHVNRSDEYPFDTGVRALPVKNGILVFDEDSKKFRLEPNTSDYKFKSRINATFDETVDPDYARSIIRAYTDQRYFIQMVAQIKAQTMTTQPYKKAYLAYGPRNAGKSTLLIDFLAEQYIGRENTSGLSLHEMTKSTDSRFSDNELEGSIFNVVDDLKNFSINDAGTFKARTGSYRISIEHKGVDKYEGRSTAVHAFTCNDDSMPTVTNDPADSEAFWMRWTLLHFHGNGKFEVNTSAADSLFDEKFKSSLLNATLELIIKMFETGKLVYEQKMEDVKETWLKTSDPVYQFFVDEMVYTGNGTGTYALKYDILRAVQLWYDRNKTGKKRRPHNTNDLTDAIKLIGGEFDARKHFEVQTKDEKGNPEYDDDGNPVMQPARTQCYFIPMVWKPCSEYEGKVRKPVVVVKQHEITGFKT